MLTLLRTLIAHKGDATDALLRQVLANAAATDDPEIRALLNHILVANRFWAALIRGVPFDVQQELQRQRTPDELAAAFSEVQHEEMTWLESALDTNLGRQLSHPLIPVAACSVADAFMQVCLHTHGHRAQVMKMLRRHDVVPVPHDFILWLSEQARTDALPPPEPQAAAPPRALSPPEIQRWLATHAGWTVASSPLPGERATTRTELTRTYGFPTFDAALGFMRMAAPFIDRTNHHPRWENSFRRVTVWLSTWDLGHVVSTLDVDLAEHLDLVAAQVMQRT